MSEKNKVADDQNLSEEELVDASLEEDQTSFLEETLDDENKSTGDDNQEEDVEALKKAKKELTIRAKKAEEKLKKLKSSLLAEDKTDNNKQEGSSEIDDILDLQAKGYSPAEIKIIKNYSKRMNISFGEVLEDPYIKAGIEAERQKNKTEEATPSPSTRVYNVMGKKKSFAEMTPEEAREAYSKLNLSKHLKLN